MARLVDEHHGARRRRRRRGRPADAYGALLRSIVGQQLSTKAARTIYGRADRALRRRTPRPRGAARRPTPRSCAPPACRTPRSPTCATWPSTSRTASSSWSALPELPDEEVSAQLTAVKGLGQWTADMFLMFHLRPPRRPAGGRPGHPARGPDRVRAAQAAATRSGSSRSPALAPVPVAGVPVPLELAGQRARLTAGGSRPGPPRRSLARWDEAGQTALPQLGSSSATRKEEPQPQEATTFGFFTSKPEPRKLSVKSTGRAVHVLQAGRVHEQADAGRVEDVVVVALLVERQRVLEARAAAAAHADPEADLALGLLPRP